MKGESIVESTTLILNKIKAKSKLELVRKALTEFKSLIDYELPINHPKVVDDIHDEKEATTKVIATNDNMDFEGKFDVDTVKNEIPNNDIKEEMFDGDINLKERVQESLDDVKEETSFSASALVQTLLEDDQSVNQNSTVSCEVCHKVFSQKYNLKTHMRIHTGEKPFSCNESGCEKAFYTNSELKKHLRIHTGEKPFSCDFCDKRFYQKSDLKKHMVMHGDVKPYKCEICEKEFFRSGDLNKHMITHYGIPPNRVYTCEVCQKEFSQSGNLNAHMRTHTGEKPFFCVTCGKAFYTKGDLTKHERTHTGERPYPCEVCQKSFARTSDLNKHMVMHSDVKPFHCETCGKSFSRSGDLNKHKIVHTGEKPYTCEICYKSFTQVSYFVRHKRMHTEKVYNCDLCHMSFYSTEDLERHEDTVMHKRKARKLKKKGGGQPLGDSADAALNEEDLSMDDFLSVQVEEAGNKMNEDRKTKLHEGVLYQGWQEEETRQENLKQEATLEGGALPQE